MIMKKQLLLLVMMLLSLVPSAYGIAVQNADGKTIYYKWINNNTELEVTHGSPKYEYNVVIPEEVTYMKKKYKVTRIGEKAFYECDNLYSVTIPNSVTSIGDYAFYKCYDDGFTSITIPNSVTSIGQSAFYDCYSLTSVTIGSGVKSIGAGAFAFCVLNKVIISDIAAWCGIEFDDDTANPARHLYSDENTEIKDLIIPNSVTSIRNYAFRGCFGLTSVTIPNSVTSIGYRAFQGCDGLTSFTIPNSVTTIGKEAFLSCSGLTSVTIGSGVTSIGEFAFWNCSGLTSITIGSGSIGYRAFLKCSSLTSVTIGSGVTSIKDEAFWRCNRLTSVTIPNSVKSIGYRTFYECSGLTSVTIGSGVTSIGSNAFYGCSGLTSVTIGSGVTSIGSNAFYGCSGLTSVTIGSGVTSIGSKAFHGCSGLTSVTIPNSVTTIGNQAFEGCSGLTSVTIGSGVTSIGGSVFHGEDIQTIISLIESPFAIYGKTAYYDGAFSPNTFNNAMLYVPTGSIDKYKSTEGWKDFMFIEEGIPVLPVNYNITYYIDGIDYISYEIEEGAEITPEAEPINKEGYTFSGWSEIPETMPAHDVTVTGTYSINSYKLTYLIDDKVYKEIMCEYEATITPESVPEKEGYTFNGWSDIPTTMPAHDVTITGTFSINSYKLIYMVDDVEYKSYDVEYEATITPIAEPTKEGYTFSGWNEIPATMPAYDVIVTGTFTINSYMLTYVVDGEVYKTYEKEYGATLAPEAKPTKEGYSFSGWSSIPLTMPAHDVTVTGSFSINKYMLTYIVDGEVYKTYDIEYGATITPEAEPTKEGYTFSGWSEIPATMPAHDVTVTGSFSINKYKLTYTVDGEVYKTYEMEYGVTITPEAEPTKEGYTFSGWSEIPATMPAHDVTVTGTFTLDTGIEEIMSNANGDVMIFTIDGKRVDNLKKGMNVIRMKDGTTRKVVVK